MRIVPLWKVAQNKGDRLWWVRCYGNDHDMPNYKMTLPLGMAIYSDLNDGADDTTMVLFYFFCFCFGFGYKRAETT